ncbi:MAG: transglutaminase-like domain-containing protein [Proteobacteria bacterium]|nr:transglutaminase-like domain-containing protein [Pseudomonadota bacterium]
MKFNKVLAGITLVLLSLSACSSTTAVVEEPGKNLIKETVNKVTNGAQSDVEKAEKIYYFVRDEIKFGWVYPQEIPAEEVLRNRKGVCMQKANLLVAMAREAGLKARFHFMHVHKTALEDFVPNFAYKRWVDPFVHTFPEVYLNGKWVSLEATFDKELHEICLKKKCNFGKYPEIAENISIEFSPEGVKAHQQYVQVEGMESFYGEDLSEFTGYMHRDVPWWKRLLQPLIFSRADNITNELRNQVAKK